MLFSVILSGPQPFSSFLILRIIKSLHCLANSPSSTENMSDTRPPGSKNVIVDATTTATEGSTGNYLL